MLRLLVSTGGRWWWQWQHINRRLAPAHHSHTVTLSHIQYVYKRILTASFIIFMYIIIMHNNNLMHEFKFHEVIYFPDTNKSCHQLCKDDIIIIKLLFNKNKKSNGFMRHLDWNKCPCCKNQVERTLWKIYRNIRPKLPGVRKNELWWNLAKITK